MFSEGLFVDIWQGSYTEPIILSPEENQIKSQLEKHVTRLASEIGSRNARIPEALEAAAIYIENTFRNSGLKVQSHEFFASDGTKARNIEAIVVGRDAESPCLVVGAHHDSVNCPGANDNASAVAALLEIANAIYLRGTPVEEERRRAAVEFKIEQIENYFGWSIKNREPAFLYMENRGITRETALKCGVGYLEKKSFKKFVARFPSKDRAEVCQTFSELGLISSNDNFLFSDRLILTVNHFGRIVGFIGRTIRPNDTRPKYIFSKNTEPKLPETLWNLDEVRDKSKIYLLEGPIDGLTLIQNGIDNVAATCGTQGFTAGKLKALKRSKIKEICLVFDSDRNRSGQQAIIQIGERLFCAGYIVTVKILPLPPGKDKIDINQFFMDGGTIEEFETLPTRDWFDVLLDSTVIEGDDAGPLQRNEILKSIYKIIGSLPESAHNHYIRKTVNRFPGIDEKEVQTNVRDFQAKQKKSESLSPYKIVEIITSRFHIIADEGGNIYRYENGVYKLWPPLEIGKFVIQIRKRHRIKDKEPSTFEIKEVIGLLQNEKYIPPERFNPPGYLNVKNRLISLETGQSENHSPENISTIQFRFNADPEAKCEIWLKTAKEILPDEEDRLLLQLIFGYCLTTDVSHHVAFIFIGEGSNGKSLILRVLNALLSEANCSHLFLSDLKERFRLFQLYHKLVNITPEVRSAELIDDASFKAMVAGDSITVEQKYKPAMTFSPTAKFIIATNNLPRTRDFSHGYFRRLIILQFAQVFEGANLDKKRFEKIVPAELPGILNWSMQGLKKLREAGGFPQTDSTRKALQEYKLEIDHIEQFRHDEIIYDPSTQMNFREVYGSYVLWCVDNGIKQMSSKAFGKRFLSASKEHQISTRKCNSQTFYIGCNLKSNFTGTSATGTSGSQKILPLHYRVAGVD